MSAYPPRPYGWRVTVAAGDTVEEFPQDGLPANRWDDLPLDDVDRLELVDADDETEPVIRWRLEDAALWVNGHEVDVVMGEVQLTRSPGELVEPVQHKKASSTYRPGHGSTTRLHGFLVGCRRRLEDLDGAEVAVVAKVNPQGEVGLRIDAPETLQGEGVALVVDGTMVHSRERFRELIAPEG